MPVTPGVARHAVTLSDANVHAGFATRMKSVLPNPVLIPVPGTGAHRDDCGENGHEPDGAWRSVAARVWSE
jgi:hypothetical protein